MRWGSTTPGATTACRSSSRRRSSRKKEFLGKVFAPTGTKDYSPYITKIRQSGADAVFLVLQGDDNNAFLSQAQQYRLPEKVKLLTEIVDLASIRAVGDASLGLIGSSRYSFTYDHPLNNEFVALWKKEHDTVPDTFEGEQWQCMKVFEAGITKAGGIEAGKLRPALEDIEIESVKGKVHHPQVRSPGRAAGLHGRGGQEAGLRHAGAAGDRHLPGREHDAELQHDDVQGLDVTRHPERSDELRDLLRRSG